MKKNLMSILILALLVVNIVLTAVMMFSVTGAMRSTTALVGRIAAVLDLELDLETGEEEVAMDSLVGYDIADMTILLKSAGEDDATQHYAAISVSIQMNEEHADYKKYAETLTTNESMIRAEIIDVVSSHTITEFQNDVDGIRSEILTRLRRMYNSDFIYKVVFSDVLAY